MLKFPFTRTLVAMRISVAFIVGDLFGAAGTESYVFVGSAHGRPRMRRCLSDKHVSGPGW
jgi:hypothetical protein